MQQYINNKQTGMIATTKTMAYHFKQGIKVETIHIQEES